MVRTLIPRDIQLTYPSKEEKVSLGAIPFQDAIVMWRQVSAEIDAKFESHRGSLDRSDAEELSEAQIESIGDRYYAHLLNEYQERREKEGFADRPKETRLLPDDPEEVQRVIQEEGFQPTAFEDFEQDLEELAMETRAAHARGRVLEHFEDEAEEVLSWDDVRINLEAKSSSRKRLARKLQESSIRAYDAMKQRNQGDIVETPPMEEPQVDHGDYLSVVSQEWINEKVRSKEWVEKVEKEYTSYMGHFVTLIGDKPMT